MGQILDASFNITADGPTDSFTYNGSKGSIQVTGDLGGGTLDLEVSMDDEQTWVVDPNFALTAAGIKYFAREVPLGARYRFNMTGSSGADCNTIVVQGHGR